MIFVMEVAGARTTTIIGSLLIFLGILLSAFAPNIYFLYLTFGLIAGEFRFLVFEPVTQHQQEAVKESQLVA